MQLVVSGYAAGYAVFLITGGRLGDLYGRRRLFLIGMAGFVAANTLWCLGYPAQAMLRSQEALAQAQELAHPFSLATAQYWAAVLYQRRREAPADRLDQVPARR